MDSPGLFLLLTYNKLMYEYNLYLMLYVSESHLSSITFKRLQDFSMTLTYTIYTWSTQSRIPSAPSRMLKMILIIQFFECYK